jgi:CRISPR-associated endoribonuclease Cas6
MRLYLKLTKSKNLIPFNYQQFLTGAIHKWIGGENTLHDATSLYSFSWLQNVDTYKGGVSTKDGSYFFISAYDEALIKSILRGIMVDPSVCFGVHVSEVQIANEPNFSEQQYFYTASPVFIKRSVNNQEKHYTYTDTESAKWLTETLQTKLKKAGLPDEGVSVSFDKDFHTPKTKIIFYKNIQNRVSICPVIVKGTPKQIAFAWNVGVGNSSGIGFGALK